MVVGVRRRMPRRRSGHTTTVTIGAERFCLTANQCDDGSLGEVFIHWGKHGTSAAGLTGSYAVARPWACSTRCRSPISSAPGSASTSCPTGTPTTRRSPGAVRLRLYCLPPGHPVGRHTLSAPRSASIP